MTLASVGDWLDSCWSAAPTGGSTLRGFASTRFVLNKRGSCPFRFGQSLRSSSEAAAMKGRGGRVNGGASAARNYAQTNCERARPI